MIDTASTPLADHVRRVLATAPEWVRVDLAAKDPGVRARAEDVLAALIMAELDKSAASPDLIER